MILAVGGNRKFPRLEIVGSALLFFLKEDPSLEVRVGKAKGVDQKTIRAFKELGIECDPIPEPTDGDFKARNGVVVKPADHLLCFNIKRWYYTGTFNAVNQFTKFHPKNWFVLLNQFGESWERNDFPPWLLNRQYYTYRTIPKIGV